MFNSDITHKKCLSFDKCKITEHILRYKIHIYIPLKGKSKLKSPEKITKYEEGTGPNERHYINSKYDKINPNIIFPLHSHP